MPPDRVAQAPGPSWAPSQIPQRTGEAHQDTFHRSEPWPPPQESRWSRGGPFTPELLSPHTQWGP